jgi:DNA-binding MarR family transcriptional regulator
LYENTIKEFFSVINEIRKSKYKHKVCEVSHVEFFMMGAIYSGKKEKFLEQKSEKGIKVSDLTKLMKGTKSATSKMLRTLEEKDYIIRISDEKDKRNVYIKLSAKGEAIFLQSINSMNQYVESIIDKMGMEDIEQLISLLNKLCKTMDEVNEKTERKDNDQ